MTFKKILRAFPPPQILDIPFAGISLSDSAIRCIQFARHKDDFRIDKYIEVPLEQGVISGGKIIKSEEVVKILGDIRIKMNLGYVKMSLPEERGYLFTAKIPMVQKNEVLSAIESKIEENVPVSPTELVFDYKLIDHRQKQHIDIVVSALPISVIDTYVDIAEKSGLSLLSLEIESQSIARALLPHHDTGTKLIVNFGPEKVGLYVVSDRIVRFTSTISTQDEVLAVPEFLAQEIKKLYIYWSTLKENIDKPEKKIEQIIVCGEGVSENIVTFLSSKIDTPVSTANVWLNAFDINETVPEISFVDSLKYSATIGLGLPTKIFI